MAMQDWANAIASIESAGSGGYSAIGPVTAKGNRAYGRYQVMDFNIGPWTEKYLGRRMTPDEFLRDPKAQDAVFNGAFGESVAKYGNPQDAASVWFTGQPQSTGAGRRDILGTSGSGYVAKFNNALGVSPAISTQDRGALNMAPEEQPMGLLGALGIQKRDPAAGGETALPFYQRDRFGNVMDALALGLSGMSMHPNQAIVQMAAGRMAERKQAKMDNRTAEMLQRMGADPKLVELAKSGYGKEAITLAYAKPKTGRVMTAEQLRQMFPGASIENGLYNLKDDNTITKVGGGGTSVNLNTGDLSPGWKKIDEKFAENYIDWNTAGAGDAVKQSQQLRGVLDALEKNVPLTGPVIGLQPDVLQSFLNPDALNARQQVEEVVQRNLRTVLGAQFTQAEGDRLIARAFDQRLSPAQNATRLRALLGQMEAAAANTAAMVDYFNEQGTLRGYKGQRGAASIKAFDEVLDNLDEQQKVNTRQGEGGTAPTSPKTGDVMTGSDGKRYRFKGGNPADPNSWEML